MRKILVYISMTVMLFAASSCGDSMRLEYAKKAYEQKDERAFRSWYRTLDAKERQKMQRYAERTARKRQAQAERRASLTQEADEILSNINK